MKKLLKKIWERIKEYIEGVNEDNWITELFFKPLSNGLLFISCEIGYVLFSAFSGCIISLVASFIIPSIYEKKYYYHINPDDIFTYGTSIISCVIFVLIHVGWIFIAVDKINNSIDNVNDIKKKICDDDRSVELERKLYQVNEKLDEANSRLAEIEDDIRNK